MQLCIKRLYLSFRFQQNISYMHCNVATSEHVFAVEGSDVLLSAQYVFCFSKESALQVKHYMMSGIRLSTTGTVTRRNPCL